MFPVRVFVCTAIHRVLTMVCRIEIEKKSGSDLPFLDNVTFHKSLFGCSLEVAALATNTTSLLVRGGRTFHNDHLGLAL